MNKQRFPYMIGYKVTNSSIGLFILNHNYHLKKIQVNITIPMETLSIIEDKGQEEMKIRAQKLALIEKLRVMGFSEKEIEYNFSGSTKEKEGVKKSAF